MKRLLSLLLAAVFVVAAVAVIPAVSGSELYTDVKESSDGNWLYVQNEDGSAKTTQYLGSETDVKLPEEIDGAPLTEIGAGTFYGSGIETVNIPSTVKTIGWWAFFNCESLTKVTIQPGVQKILFGAFINCLALYEVDIPSTVYRIDTDAFAVSIYNENDVKDSKSKQKVSVQSYFNNGDFVIRGYDGTCAQTYAEQSYLTFESLGSISFGDLNGDGSINNKDVVLIKNSMLKNEKLTNEQKLSADVDCNGKVDDNDIALLKNYLEGKCAYKDLLPFSGSYAKTTRLSGKSLYCAGDSVCKGTGTDIMGEKLYSYANYIADLYGMKLKNDAYGGTTLAKQKDKKGDMRSIMERVLDMKGRYDVVIVEGGFNDLFQKIKTGKMTDKSDKSGKYDEYTTAGALEKICYFLNKNYKSSIKLFVLGHRMTDMDDQDKYWSLIRQILDKWDMPYVDISQESDFCNLNSEITDIYFAYNEKLKSGDGIHPCAYAHANVYGPIIDKRLNELAVSDSSITFEAKTVDLAMGESYSQIPSYRGSNYFVKYHWSSSEPDLARVDQFGKVSTLGIGTAYIKVEADDDSYASYCLNIKKAPICLFLNATELYLKPDETFRLKGILIRDSASYHNSFISTNPAVASVSSDGVIKARAAGTAKVICKACNGVKTECIVSVE